MTTRGIFLLLIVPLFLLLAGVNGALLYLWERGEAARGLENQALAAAVTTAAFAASSDDLARALAEPGRNKAIRLATSNITGLDGLYIVTPGQAPLRIAGPGTQASLENLSAPTVPTALPIRANAAGYRVATALVPTGRGDYVIAQIDAEALFAQVAGLERLIAALLAGAGLVGLLLAWLVASRIRRELLRNSAMIEAIRKGGPPVSVEGLAIRETLELAQAVRLMQTSVAGRMTRGDRELAARDRERDEAGAVADFRQSAFPPCSATAAGRAVAIRTLGDPPAGCFFALCEREGRGALVLGECAGDGPAEALARARSAQRYFEHEALTGSTADAVSLGQRAFALTRVEWREWSAGDDGAVPVVLALLDGTNGGKAEVYAARATGLSADAIAADLVILLEASGFVAVLGESSQP